MPVLSRSFRERDPLKVGVVGLIAVVLLGFGILNAGDALRSFRSKSFTAEFTEIGTLKTGDEVRLGGTPVGTVDDIHIDGGHVDVEFSVADAGDLGDATRVAIKAATVLGAKYLAVLPAGTGAMDDGTTIPADRAEAPYDITQALSQFTGITADLDVDQVSRSMNVLADTFADTPPELRSALAGVRRLSDTLASRDQALRDLLGHSDAVTGQLAERSGQLVSILADGNLLLDELDRRRAVIQQLLITVTATLDQLNGLVRDNEDQIKPALDGLRGVLDLLNRQDENIAATIHGVKTYATSLNEAVGAGPWFFALVPNLVPSNLAPLLPSVLGQGR